MNKNALICLLCGVGLAMLPSAHAQTQPSVATLIAKLRLEESATPVREHKGWRKPKKIVVLGGLPDREAFAAAAGGAELVVTRDHAAAVAAAKDADIVVGLTNEGSICEPDLIDGAKQLRWIHSMSAGVERCMTIPSVKTRDILVT